MISLSDIRTVFSGVIKLGEPLAKHTTLGVGGSADYFLEPSSKQELDAVVKYFSATGFPYVILHPGMLVSDGGFRGAVILAEAAALTATNGQRRATMFRILDDVSPEAVIHKAGLANITLGGAEISGNYVVNAADAQASDIYSLVTHVQRLARETCGVHLELELQAIGFESDALVKVA